MLLKIKQTTDSILHGVATWLSKESHAILVLTIFLLAISFQGFDFCDEGFAMSAYQQFFKAPESEQSFFSMYLTGFMGGVWEALFGWGGYLSYRILNIVFNIAIFHLVYLMSWKQTKSTYLLAIGFFLVLAREAVNGVYSYSISSCFLGIATCAALCKACKDEHSLSVKWLCVASFLTGVNVFARIPNLCLIGLVGIALLLYLWKDKSWKMFFYRLGIALVGFILGIFLILAIMWMQGHLDIFILCLRNLISRSASSTSSHSIPHMLSVYMDEYAMILKIALLVSITSLASVRMINHEIGFKLKSLILLVLELGVIYWIGYFSPFDKVVMCIALIRFVVSNVIKNQKITNALAVLLIACEIGLLRLRYTPIIFLFGLSFPMFIYAVYYYRYDFKKVYLLSLAFVLAYLLPFGSDFGIRNVGFCSILFLFPLCLSFMYDILRLISNHTIRSFYKYSFILTMLIFLGYNFIYTKEITTWMNSGSRLNERYLITQSDLATTFTTKEKAEAIDTLLVHLKPYVHEGDYAFYVSAYPTLHYLTKTKPYLFNPWPALSMNPVSISRAEREIEVLPVLVRGKGVDGYKWTEASDIWDRADVEDVDGHHKPELVALIQDFIKRHSYYIVWENDLFAIYLPEDK